MGLRMPSPYRHKDSGIFWLKVRVPADLVQIVGRKVHKLSLKTRDPAEAKASFISEMGKIETQWANLRRGTLALSHKEAIAVAGEFYRKLISDNEDDPGDRRRVMGQLLADQVAAADDGVKIIRAGKPDITDRLLDRLANQHRAAVEKYFTDRGERLDPESFERVLQAVNQAMLQGREQLLRFVDGDYRPDPDADRFPARIGRTDTHHTDAKGDQAAYSLQLIYGNYASESEQAASTKKKWGAIIELVAETHPDIRTITPVWCVAWKDTLVKQGLSARTIQYGYMAALRSTCAWAKTNKLISSNPMDDIGIKVKKTPKSLKRRGYTDEEAKFVLSLTMQPVTEDIFEHHKLARRWIPWICCYTGARVGEIAQLRKQDISVVGDIALFWITPEAGAVKDGNSRYVAVHSHLVEQGFMKFVESATDGPLFYDPALARGGSDGNPQTKKVGERLSKWIRANGVTDKRLAPNHAWRHRFKTVSRECDMDPGTRDYMQGHVPHNDAEDYGYFPPKVLSREIEKIPRIVLD